jgi:hypothetical protein
LLYLGCELAQRLTNQKKTKPRSDVYFIQILSKVSRLEASQYPIGTQLPFEI